MKKMVFTLAVLSVMLFPALLMAQPPRPHSGYRQQSRPARPANIQVHVPQHRPHAPQPPRMMTQYGHGQHHPYHSPYHYAPHHMRPQPYGVVVVPQVVVPGHYVPAGGGVSLTIGGRHGAVSVYRGY